MLRAADRELRTKEVSMRKVIASEFVSLDGVMESPDQWHFPYFNDEMGEAIGAAMAQADAMLLGRVLYEEWAAYWPQQDPEENPFAARMNGIQKYVVSKTLEEPLEWNNSTLINGDVAEEITKLKQQPGKGIAVFGGPTLTVGLIEMGPARRAAGPDQPDRPRRRPLPVPDRQGPAAGGAAPDQDLQLRQRAADLPAGLTGRQAPTGSGVGSGLGARAAARRRCRDWARRQAARAPTTATIAR
jgi:dihydrofolate reductase